MVDTTRRTVLRGIAGASAGSVLGVSGTSAVAAQSAQWDDAPGIDRDFSFDTGGPVPSRVEYVDGDTPSEETFELTGNAPAGSNGTGLWLAEYDGTGTEQYSTTIYDPDPGYPTWGTPLLSSTGTDLNFFAGFTQDDAGDRQAMYAAGVENDTDVQWTATFADDVDWEERQLGVSGFSWYSERGGNNPTEKIATGGSNDPVAHDDWIGLDGTVTRNITVSDSSIESVDAVSHYSEFEDGSEKPWIYMFGTGTDGGVFAQAASPNDQQEWHTPLSEFADEEVLTGSYSFTADQEPAYVVASDANGTGSWIKTLDGDGNVVNEATYSPPADGDSATQVPFSFLGYFTIGPTDSGSWVRSIADDLTENWTTSLDGEARSVGPVGDFLNPDGYLVSGRRNDAPTFWRLDSGGSIQWDVTLGNDQSDFLREAGVGPDDAFILAGRTGSMGDGDANPWLVRVEDADGSVAWEETYGGADWDNLPFVTPPETDDGVLFAENSDSTVDVLDLSTAVTRDPDDGDGDDDDDGDDGSGGIVDQYDEDDDGDISIGELGAAAGDFARGDIGIGELGMIAAAFAGN